MASFRWKQHGERIEGAAVGIDPRHLERLRKGRVAVELELDLHGLRAAEAQGELHRALAAAYREGTRCVLVIHGRGTRSESGPVLKSSLIGWFEGEPLAGIVMAFATARPEDGGAGATYVLLRRARSGRSRGSG